MSGALATAVALACAAACDGGGDTPGAPGGSGGSGGAAGGGGGQGGGGVDCSVPDDPPPPSDDWCERLPAGPAGAGPAPVDWSAAHAMVRFFGPVKDYTTADQALAGALSEDDAWTGDDLSAYAGALPGAACARAAADVRPSLGPGAVTLEGEVAIVTPGTGAVALPAEAKAVLVDLRGLPWAPGLEEALVAAVSPALATPVAGLYSKVREHEGMVDEVFSATNVYQNGVITVGHAAIPATGTAELPLALLTEAVMPPEAVELAVTLRLAKRAWIIGEDLRVGAAEARWHGVGASGLAVRVRDLLLAENGARLPDSVAADRRTATPQCFAADILSQGPLGDATLGLETRPKILKVSPFDDQQPPAAPLGDARAALVTSHGAARLFYPYFDTVGDLIDDRLLETTAGLSASPSRTETYHALRRLGAALSDGHQFVFDHQSPVVGYLAVMIEDLGGEAVIRRSAAPGIDPGDTVVSIDGVPADEWYAVELARSGGATDGYRFDIATRQLTAMSGAVELGLQAADGTPKTVVAEPQPLEQFLSILVASSRPAGFLDDLGAPQLYYINLDASVTTSIPAFQAALAEASTATGLVLDMRGYPGVNHYQVAQRLIQVPFSSPVFRVPIRSGPDELTVDESNIALSPLASPSFAGPIALLVGHHSVSAAENFSTMLVDADRVTVVGRQSAGTNGNITGVQLPGGFELSFTGMEVRHADPAKSTFHGLGILPDIDVPLSAADLAAGTDPELEAAVTWLLTQ